MTEAQGLFSRDLASAKHRAAWAQHPQISHATAHSWLSALERNSSHDVSLFRMLMRSTLCSDLCSEASLGAWKLKAATDLTQHLACPIRVNKRQRWKEGRNVQWRERGRRPKRNQEQGGRVNRRGQTGGTYHPQEDLSLTLEPQKQSRFLSLPPSRLAAFLTSFCRFNVLSCFLVFHSSEPQGRVDNPPSLRNYDKV